MTTSSNSKITIDRCISCDRNTRNVTRRKPKFYYASLAMLASKGLNTEDRVIPRGKRKGEKGNSFINCITSWCWWL